MQATESGDDAVAAHDAASRFSAAGGTLYVVATPLGNLRDVTLRALDVLGSADVIAAEDTRVTTVLLRHYGIATRPLSMHEHNEARRVAHIERLLRAGKSVALVSDAGTPAVSDPGARLVAAIRSAGLNVVPIPGANAAVAAISAAGLDAERFVFMGFLPPGAKARRALLASVAQLPLAIVIYEAPHRAVRTIAELTQALGGGRTLFIAREITKKFETLARLPLNAAAAWLERIPIGSVANSCSSSIVRRIRRRKTTVRLIRCRSTAAALARSCRRRARLESPPMQLDSRVMHSSKIRALKPRPTDTPDTAVIAGFGPLRYTRKMDALAESLDSRALCIRMGGAPRAVFRARRLAHGARGSPLSRSAPCAKSPLSGRPGNLPGDPRASTRGHRGWRPTCNRDRCRRARSRADHDAWCSEVVPVCGR